MSATAIIKTEVAEEEIEQIEAHQLLDLNGKQVTLMLIGLMRQEEVMWDHASPDYYNKQMRRAALKRIADKLGGDVKLVKSRWHNIRTCYSRELRKVQSMLQSGVVYNPRWVFFTEVDSFLRPACILRQKVPQHDNSFQNQTFQESSDVDGIDASEEDSNLLAHENQQVIAWKPTAHLTSMDNSESPGYGLRKRKAPFTESDSPSPSLRENEYDDYQNGQAYPQDSKEDVVFPIGKKLSEIEEDAFIFGKLVANGIKRIKDARTRELTKIQVQNVIFAAQFGESSPLNVSQTLPSIPQSSSQQSTCTHTSPGCCSSTSS